MDPTAVVANVFRRWWWALLLIVVASGGLSYLVAKQFGNATAEVQGTLIYAGLPPAQANGVYQPIDTNTAAEMLQSIDLMREWADARELGVPPALLREFLSINNPRYSKLVEIKLTWANAEDGVEMLNDLMERFINRMVQHRRQLLADHIKHVESGLLSAKAEMDQARRQLRDLRLSQQEEIDAGGLNSERYKSLLARVASTQLAIDEKLAEENGVLQQISVIEGHAGAIESARNEAFAMTRREALKAVETRLLAIQDRFANNSAAGKGLLTLVNKIKAQMVAPAKGSDAAESDEPTSEEEETPELWLGRLYALLMPPESELSRLDHERLLAEIEEATQSPLRGWAELDAEHRKTTQRIQEMQIQLIPLKNQTQMLTKRLADYEQQAEEVGDELMGSSLTDEAEYEQRVEQAESRQAAIVRQLEAMRELEACRVREWTVSTAASMETTVTDSNRKKLFVLAFGMIGLTLTAPLVLTEWNQAKATPTARFASATSVPMIADRVLQYTEADRADREVPEPTAEALRMLALRIQQSTHRTGSVVLFSSVDGADSPAPLLAAVADCLAERDERVLVVDAVCPARSRLPITGLFEQTGGEGAGEGSGVSNTPASRDSLEPIAAQGLSEYLVEDCDSLAEIVRPTGRPGIDLVMSGQAPFPREAMASVCLTRLLDEGRQRYSMILVNAPPTTSSADLQMLAARADGVVLTAGRRALKNPAATSAVNELVEIGAPIIGVVG